MRVLVIAMFLCEVFILIDLEMILKEMKKK